MYINNILLQFSRNLFFKTQTFERDFLDTNFFGLKTINYLYKNNENTKAVFVNN